MLLFYINFIQGKPVSYQDLELSPLMTCFLLNTYIELTVKVFFKCILFFLSKNKKIITKKSFMIPLQTMRNIKT